MNDRIKLFLKYAEHHAADWYTHDDGKISYCYHMSCNDCYYHTDCSDVTSLNYEEFNFIKSNHPEYFL